MPVTERCPNCHQPIGSCTCGKKRTWYVPGDQATNGVHGTFEFTNDVGAFDLEACVLDYDEDSYIWHYPDKLNEAATNG